MKLLIIGVLSALLFTMPARLGAEKITILYSNATFTGTGLFVAKDAGFCKQKGIDLELVLGGGSAPTVSAVVGGYALGALEVLLTAIPGIGDILPPDLLARIAKALA